MCYTFNTDLQDFLTVLHRRKGGRRSVTPLMLLSNLLAEYVASRLTLSRTSADQLAYTCASLSKFHGREIRVDELSPPLVLPWLRDRVQTRARRTAKGDRGNLLTLWRWGYAQGYVTMRPEGIPTIPVPKRLPAYWQPTELEALITACRAWGGEMRGTGILRAHWWSSFVLSAFCTGARLSALLAVQPAACSLAERRLTLRAESAKTGIEQVCNLTDQAVAAIAAHYESTRDRVWPWPYRRAQLFTDLAKLLRRAGLPCDRYRKFHCFRRTCATLTTQAAGIAVAQSALGHTSEAMTRNYVHPDAMPQQHAADVLPRLDL